MMYRIEYDKEIDGKKVDLYRVETPTGTFEKVLFEKEDRRKLERAVREIHSMREYEDHIIFSCIMLLYIWLCWFILRKYPWEPFLNFLIFVVSMYFVFSIWLNGSNLQESAEALLLYVSRQ